ncbi:rCG44454 [Rattus norvegicus]|uniref:glyceraldehyde-3-phosphate dehydrogenase (phosphorylating) n=1 Tax=Rattus norvegicus TaxID=10116 RepID=A6I5B8_RAT|nr:rCG44454 [Rattus norvegicus]
MPSLPHRRLWRALLGSYDVMPVKPPRTSMLPIFTGAGKALGKIISKLNWKLSSLTCVPITNVPIVELTCCLDKASRYDDIKKSHLRGSWATLRTQLLLQL